MPSTAILFPGQGSQTPEMRDTVARERPDLLAAVTAAVGEDPFPRVEDGTQFAQPAILVAALAGWEALGRPAPEFMAGHSLGELAAMIAAGCLEEPDGLRLVALRGRLMAQARQGGMLALLGAGAGEHGEAIAAEHGLAVANDNSPGQVVLSGDRAGLVGAAGMAAGLRLRAIELPVTGAFHSPLMAPAVPAFRAALESVEFRPPSSTVLSAVTAAPMDDPVRRLAEGLTMPVRWRETMLALRDLGAERFVETGPGRVLIGLAKRTVGEIELAHA